jgi:hypothetical protein
MTVCDMLILYLNSLCYEITSLPKFTWKHSLYHIMKFSWAMSWVKWLNSEKTNISKTISALVLRVLIWTRTETVFEMLVFFTVQPLDLADSLRELHYNTHLLGKQQILNSLYLNEYNSIIPYSDHGIDSFPIIVQGIDCHNVLLSSTFTF